MRVVENAVQEAKKRVFLEGSVGTGAFSFQLFYWFLDGCKGFFEIFTKRL